MLSLYTAINCSHPLALLFCNTIEAREQEGGPNQCKSSKPCVLCVHCLYMKELISTY